MKHSSPPRGLIGAAFIENAGGYMSKELVGKRVAILVTDGFEEVEMTELRKALNDAGAVTALISICQRSAAGAARPLSVWRGN